MKINVKNLNIKELEVFFISINEKKYRARQVFSWLYKGIYSFDEMSDLSKDLREKLNEYAFIEKLQLISIQTSKNDGTRKYLFGLSDGNSIESVFMKYKFGNTICISSQAGCRMGCKFCASTVFGLHRNLTASEMVDQIIAVEKDTGESISNVVVMGTGEPFDNYENLLKFIELIHLKDGKNLGLRNITVSTCGIIPKIREFAKEYPQVNLAISLHGPNDTIRSRIMPVNKRYGIDELLKVCREYIELTGRRISFEYALIKDVNDSDKNAEELTSKLRGMNCHVNLIPLNNVEEAELNGTDREGAEKFRDYLVRRGIETTIRRELGSDIEAACGQLRLKSIKN